MVRRDDDGSPAGGPGENPSSRCGDPAGASPVSVSGNAPSSRLPARGEIPASEAERREPGNRQEPLTGRQARGPQLEVKTAASSHLQSESVGCEPTGRAAHFTAKATSTMRDRQRVGGLGGVRVAARVQGSSRNTREPSAQPPSRPGASYKSKTKSNTAQRKSEGTIVPLAPATKAVQHNAAGGKGPWGLSRVDRRGTRKGMDAERPNSPRRRSPEDNVRRLQGRLRDVAKQQPGRKFHALYDRIYRSDVLYEAWNQVRRNQGAAGVDAQTIAAIEQNGVESFLEAIQAELRENEYQPQAVLRRYIAKSDGKQQRPLGIPTVRDRVVQAAAKLILEPIFEVGFQDCSYGFRPRRSTTQALEKIRVIVNRGFNHVLDGDIRDFFGQIDHSVCLSLVGRKISDRRVLKLVKQWLEARGMEDGLETTKLSGAPQGGGVDPPTRSQTWRRGRWLDRDRVTNDDAIIIDENLLYKSAQDSLPLLETEVGAAGLQLLGEAGDVIDELQVVLRRRCTRFVLFDCMFEFGTLRVQSPHARAKLVEVDKVFLVRIEELLDRALGLRELSIEVLAARRALLAGTPQLVDATFDLATDQVRILDESCQLRPNHRVDLIGSQRGIVAARA